MKKHRMSRALAILLLIAMMISLMPTAALAEDSATGNEDEVVAIPPARGADDPSDDEGQTEVTGTVAPEESGDEETEDPGVVILDDDDTPTEDPPVITATATLTKLTEAPADGDKIVIFHPTSTMALTAEADGKKLKGVEATPEEGKLELAEDMAFLTVHVEEEVYRFELNGQFLTSGEAGNALSFAADGTSDLAKWKLTRQEDGTWYLMNVGANYNGNYNQALEYYKGFTTYGVKDNNNAYKFDFYGEVPATVTLSKLTEAPADGDKIVIFHPTSTMALTAEADGKKLKGVEATPEEGKLELAEDMACLTVHVEEEVYRFELNGQFLTSGEAGNALSFAADGTSDLAKWKLTRQEDGTWYLMNVGANYNGNYNQALEYYKGFTTYGVKDNNNAYKFVFYGVVKGTPEEPDTPDEPEDTDIKVGTLVTSLDQLTDGATVLIYSPTHKTAASSTPNGDRYIKAVGPVTDSFTAPLVWTVSVKDGAYRFSNGESVFSAWPSDNYVELTVNAGYNADTVSDWNLASCSEENHTWFMSSTTLKIEGKTAHVQAYLRNGTEVFSGRPTETPGEKDYGLQFYLVDPEDAVEETDDGEWDGVLAKDSQIVIYNASAEGVFGLPNEMGIAMTVAPATIADGKAQVTNGALVFTVAATTGRYYVLETGGKYLASNNAEELYLAETVSDLTKWYLTKNGDGYLLYNKSANYNGTPVCVEFFSGSFSGWTFKSTDADIFRFQFYSLTEGTAVVNGVAQVPAVLFDCEDTRYVEQDYAVKFTLDDLAAEITSINISFNVGEKSSAVSEYTVEGKTYSFTIPAAELDGQGIAESFVLTVQARNSYDIAYQGTKTVEILDEPFIGKLTPAANAQTLEDKRPVISAEIGNVGEDSQFTMTVNDESVGAKFEDGVLSYQADEDMADGRYTVKVSATRSDDKTVEKTWSFYVGKAQFQLFFGQLHSHTTYSDGSGTLEAALDYVSNIPASGNIQFVAFTDHSNYFDTTGAPNPEAALYDVSQMTAASLQLWKSYRDTVAAFNARQSNIIAIAGFEMTWSGGPGHINTFNSPGLVSRNNATLNNKTNDAGMKAYYELLDNEALTNALSQFNHPGKTFGNFTDFSYWNAVTDSRIYLVEVGNGEGQIGAGGYYPSYEQYIMALDKGWHVAPTNNQDNHKGRWGNANDARDVIYTDDFSEQGIYNAIRQYRVYATEDKNLEIQYKVNDKPLGTIFSEIPEELNFEVSVYDPDAKDSITKVELVVNSGKVIYTWDDPNEIASGLLKTTLAPSYNYYFVRVTQADGDLAVTAPVWVGESLKLGISALECGTSSPVTGEEFTLSTTFFNSENKPATIKSIIYTTNGSEVIGTNTAAGEIPASSTSTVDFTYTPEKAKIMTITATAVIELGGQEYTFTKDITLEVKDSDALVYIGIDASHYNEYVAGNYKDSMGNFGALAAGYGVRTVELKTSEELIAACGNEKFMGIIFTAPSRRLSAAQENPGVYSEAELAAIAAFNANGGQVIVCGWGDNYENYESVKDVKQMAETQNELLNALGSSIRLGDDEVVDDELNGGQAQRLYFSSFNFESYLMDGIIVDPSNPNDRNYSEVFSNYGGCSVYFTGSGVPATVTPVVFGHSSTYTKDCDGDGRNELVYPYGENGNRVVALATESQSGKGLIIVSGAAFMSNFEVQAAISSGSTDSDTQKNYANYKICENLVKGYNELTITDIGQVQKQTESGLVYTIEGTVTSNASGYDKDTAFFDCIYVQDATGGICCFPVSGNFKIGDRVRVTGYTDFYQGEMELQVMSISLIGTADPVEPKEVTAAQINDLSVLGSLVTLKGTVESFELENGLIQTILVKDAEGSVARVFVDGYISTGKEIENVAVGAEISATGLSSFDDTWKDTNYFPRIRVRNREDVVCTSNEPAVQIRSKTLTLDGKLLINVYMELPDSILADNGAYVTVNGERIAISTLKTKLLRGKLVYGVSHQFRVMDMNDPIELKVFTGEGAAVRLLDPKGNDVTETGYIYCPQDYVNAVRASDNEKLKTLVNALSDLGCYAQRYFNYHPEQAAETVLDLSTVTLKDLETYASVITAREDSPLQYKSASLQLTEDTMIRIFFTLKSGSLSDYTFMINGKTVTPVSKNGKYYVEYGGVSCKDLDQPLTLTVTDGMGQQVVSVSYSVLSYVYSAMKQSTNELLNLVKALYLYSQAANAYFGN